MKPTLARRIQTERDSLGLRHPDGLLPFPGSGPFPKVEQFWPSAFDVSQCPSTSQRSVSVRKYDDIERVRRFVEPCVHVRRVQRIGPPMALHGQGAPRVCHRARRQDIRRPLPRRDAKPDTHGVVVGTIEDNLKRNAFQFRSQRFDRDLSQSGKMASAVARVFVENLCCGLNGAGVCMQPAQRRSPQSPESFLAASSPRIFDPETPLFY